MLNDFDRIRTAAGVGPLTPIDDLVDAVAQATRCAPSRLVREFHGKFGLPTEGDEPPFVLNELRARLIREEAAEAVVEIERGTDKAAMAKELADVVYVVYGAAETFGIDLDEALAQVHRSNMTKQARGQDGKVIKGPDYVEPDMSSAVVPPPVSSEAATRIELELASLIRLLALAIVDLTTGAGNSGSAYSRASDVVRKLLEYPLERHT